MIDKFLAFCVFWLPLMVALTYFTIAIAHALKGNKGLAVMWGSYGLANAGLLYAISHGEGH